MAATRRLGKEVKELKEKMDGHHEPGDPMLALHSVEANEANILIWNATIHPNKIPYLKGAFKIEVQFPAEYPFKPPKIMFKTKIYHPNIDEKGQVCLPIINPENWKPATKTEQVLCSLVSLVEEPEPEHPLRADLAEEYSKDKKKFYRAAEEYTKKHALERAKNDKPGSKKA